MLKTVVVLHYFFLCENCDTFIGNIFFCNITNVFTVTFDQFNVSLLNKNMILFKKKN